jgi:hypothetical protein
MIEKHLEMKKKSKRERVQKENGLIINNYDYFFFQDKFILCFFFFYFIFIF